MTAHLVKIIRSAWAQMAPRRGQLELSVQKSVRIGEKAVATAVEFEGELLLLGVTNQSVTLIQRRNPAALELQVRGTVA